MLQLFTRTDKKLIPTLPRYTFSGRIILVQSENEAEQAVRYLRLCQILGLDTETRPSFRKGMANQVALLQIAANDLCFLFRLNYIGFPKCLIELLEDPETLKVGLSLKDDFHQLRSRYKDFSPQNYVDLQQLALEMGIEDMSLAKLFANFFRKRISKTAQLSNWEADTLDEKQRVYAATDADACIKLYQLMKELRHSGDFELLPPPTTESEPHKSLKPTKTKNLKSADSKTKPKTRTTPKKNKKISRKTSTKRANHKKNNSDTAS